MPTVKFFLLEETREESNKSLSLSLSLSDDQERKIGEYRLLAMINDD